MSGETWRVVLATGEVREVRVEPAVAYGYMAPLSEVRGHRATRTGEGTVFAAPEAMGDTAEDAVTRLASLNGWPVREILAPGEPTRAEAIDAARREGAEAAREACASRFEVRASGFDDAAREWGRRSEPNLVADCERQARAARIEAATIRALPLPGEVTS